MQSCNDRAGRFGDMATLVSDVGEKLVDGILLDLGVSSPQLDIAERGFSFRPDLNGTPTVTKSLTSMLVYEHDCRAFGYADGSVVRLFDCCLRGQQCCRGGDSTYSI